MYVLEFMGRNLFIFAQVVGKIKITVRINCYLLYRKHVYIMLMSIKEV